LYCPQGF